MLSKTMAPQGKRTRPQHKRPQPPLRSTLRFGLLAFFVLVSALKPIPRWGVVFGGASLINGCVEKFPTAARANVGGKVIRLEPDSARECVVLGYVCPERVQEGIIIIGARNTRLNCPYNMGAILTAAVRVIFVPPSGGLEAKLYKPDFQNPNGESI